MRKNQSSKATNKKNSWRFIWQLSAIALLGTIGLFIWQSSASMQSSITPNNTAGNRETVKNYQPTTQEPNEVAASPACSTLAYATTLRFPGGGVTENQLISFNTSTPGTIINDVAVQGLDTSKAEYMSAIDFRPATGELYGLIVQNNTAAGGSGTVRIVKVDPATGATTAIGTPTTVVDPGNFSSFDFNPVVDRIRYTKLVTGRDLNFVIDPTTGVFTAATPLAYNTGDPNAGADEFIVGGAYTNNVTGATQTTLYAIDSTLDRLVRIGSVNGTPNSPSTGLLDTVGALGVNTSGLVGFDIGSDGVAFAVLDTAVGDGTFGSPGRLYTINLTTGAATLVAPIGGLATRFTSGLAVSACPTTPVIASTGTTITAESCGLPNSSPDPGETVTVSLPITNNGGGTTTNLTATLQATGGVTSPTPASQNYGAIAAGATVTRNFTFTVASNIPCGSNITLTFTVADGATTYANITKSYATGANSVSLSQNFDGVTAPALPTGWTSVQTSGTAVSWVTTTTTPSSAPNAAFGNEVVTVNAAALTTPAVAITSASAQITFKNQFNLEDTFDGTVLEYSTNNGSTWTDVITGGGSFVSGGYTDTISTGFMSPIGGRMAWSGASGGYLTTTVNLPASLNGQSVQFRWLTASDSSVVATGAAGQWIDDVQVLGGRVCQSCPIGSACQIQRRSDFDGDGTTDFAVFRPSSGTWYVQPNGAASAFGAQFGASGDKLQPADYDGDGKTDLAVFRGGVWYWLRSSDNTLRQAQWGLSSDIPVAGDYVGSSQAELAVYRPSNGVWYALNTADNTMTATQWGGAATDIPVLGDFDGDCKLDLAVRRTTNSPQTGDTQFYIRYSGSATSTEVRWGRSDMALAIADYNGDGKSDVGVVATGSAQLNWYVITADSAAVLFYGTPFGTTNDVVTVGNYDADQKADFAVWRPATGQFIYRPTAGGAEAARQFGTSGDIPTARAAQYPLP